MAFLFAMKAKVIKPKPLDTKAMLAELKDAAQDVARDVRRDLEDITATWNHQPDFDVNVKLKRDQTIKIQAGTDDDVFNYLDKGTSVRRALMSRDWQSKTKPAIGGGAAVHLRSGPGAGAMVYVSRRLNLPGIKARKFFKAVAEKNERAWKATMQRGMSKAAKRSGHAR